MSLARVDRITRSGQRVLVIETYDGALDVRGVEQHENAINERLLMERREGPLAIEVIEFMDSTVTYLPVGVHGQILRSTKLVVNYKNDKSPEGSGLG